MINIASTTFTLFLLAAPAAVPQRPGALSDGHSSRKYLIDDDHFMIVRGQTPRLDGKWYEYAGLKTPLRGNVFISDMILPDSHFEHWDGIPAKTFDVEKQTPENYAESHNHYQNILSEVLNFRKGANAVAIWGDSAAMVSGSQAWGGFVSARSSCAMGLLSSYVPNGVEMKCGPDFDAQVIGLEVDVLNGGKPGVWPNKSKTGIEIVGFGVPNSMAIEVRSEDADKDTKNRRGVFESGLYFKNAIHPEYGRLVVADFDEAMMGLDLRRASFKSGAIQLRSETAGTGILYNNGQGGEIHSGLRWPGFKDPGQWLSLRAGNSGLRIASHDTTREFLAIDNFGGIYLQGDVYVKGQRLENLALGVSLKAIIIAALASALLSSFLTAWIVAAKLGRGKGQRHLPGG